MANTKHDELFGIASDVERVSIELDRVWNLLQLYDNMLGEDVRTIKPDEPWTAAVFLEQFELLRSQLEAIVILFRSCREGLQIAVDKSYEYARKGRDLTGNR